MRGRKERKGEAPPAGRLILIVIAVIILFGLLWLGWQLIFGGSSAPGEGAANIIGEKIDSLKNGGSLF